MNFHSYLAAVPHASYNGTTRSIPYLPDRRKLRLLDNRCAMPTTDCREATRVAVLAPQPYP